MRNYAYLFWGYSVVWIGLAAYLAVLFAQLRATRRRLDNLERQVRRLEGGPAQRDEAS